ncbi:MAG: tRNA methyl transferase PRC-barrel domain-containing protein, partial [Fidelibacterota bacterium]
DLATAQTPESMEICFVPDNNYKRFLQEYSPNEVDSIGAGDILENDKVVGKHDGYIRYTIGQRKGLGLSNPEPRYVQKINPESNTIVVSKKNGLYSDNCNVSSVNWLVDSSNIKSDVFAQIRYNSQPVSAEINNIEEGRLAVNFIDPQLAVTPGQSVVFYNREEPETVLGGGIIER